MKGSKLGFYCHPWSLTGDFGWRKFVAKATTLFWGMIVEFVEIILQAISKLFVMILLKNIWVYEAFILE